MRLFECQTLFPPDIFAAIRSWALTSSMPKTGSLRGVGHLEIEKATAHQVTTSSIASDYDI